MTLFLSFDHATGDEYPMAIISFHGYNINITVVYVPTNLSHHFVLIGYCVLGQGICGER